MNKILRILHTHKTSTFCQVKDRKLVSERMKAHVQSSDTTPLLIFPEGTCVNNEYCVMFKRGAFDLGATVCPIAIKYNKVFVDAFWNSKRQSFTAHLVRDHIKMLCWLGLVRTSMDWLRALRSTLW